MFENQTLLQEQMRENARLYDEWGKNADATVASSCVKPGPLPMPVCMQPCNMWCWATVTSMTVDYYKKQSTCQGLICQVPSRELGLQCCPYTSSCNATGPYSGPNGTATPCNQPGKYQFLIDAAEHFTGGNFSAYGPLNQTTLDFALNSGRPVMIAVSWTWGGGHILMIGGCGNGKYYLHDPWGWFKNQPAEWQSLSYGQLLKYPAPDDWGIGTWIWSVTWSLDDEAGHKKALQQVPNTISIPAAVV